MEHKLMLLRKYTASMNNLEISRFDLETFFQADGSVCEMLQANISFAKHDILLAELNFNNMCSTLAGFTWAF